MHYITIHLKELGHEQVECSDLVKGRDFYIGEEKDLSPTEGDNRQKE